MDYDFTTDPIHDYVARCSADHTALGYWLTAEIGANDQRINALLGAIERIQQRRSWEFELEGVEYSLQLSPEQAVVRAHALSADTRADDPSHGDESEFFDDGLNDFDDG
jgi:uncharacterized protein YacL (UPF0231 family)